MRVLIAHNIDNRSECNGFENTYIYRGKRALQIWCCDINTLLQVTSKTCYIRKLKNHTLQIE